MEGKSVLLKTFPYLAVFLLGGGVLFFLFLDNKVEGKREVGLPSLTLPKTAKKENTFQKTQKNLGEPGSQQKNILPGTLREPHQRKPSCSGVMSETRKVKASTPW